MSGKGDTPRPLSIPKEEFDKKFESIFERKEDKPSEVVSPTFKQDIDFMDGKISELEQDIQNVKAAILKELCNMSSIPT